MAGASSEISSGLDTPWAGAANDDSTAVVFGSYDISLDQYYRIGVSATITALATVDGPFFDFAQSPL